MNRFRVLGAGLFFLFSAGVLTPAVGQQVTLTLRQPAPNRLSLEDLWQGNIAGLTCALERSSVDDPVYSGTSFDETVIRVTLSRGW